MKKYILVCSFILSAFTFSATHDNHQNQQSTMNEMPMMQSQNGCPKCGSEMMKNMSQMPRWKGDQKLMKSNMMYATPEMQKSMIDIEQKELDIKKEMLEDKVDWSKVEKLNKEIAQIKADIQTKVMKQHFEMMKSTPTPVKQ